MRSSSLGGVCHCMSGRVSLLVWPDGLRGLRGLGANKVRTAKLSGAMPMLLRCRCSLSGNLYFYYCFTYLYFFKLMICTHNFGLYVIVPIVRHGCGVLKVKTYLMSTQSFKISCAYGGERTSAQLLNLNWSLSLKVQFLPN